MVENKLVVIITHKIGKIHSLQIAPERVLNIAFLLVTLLTTCFFSLLIVFHGIVHENASLKAALQTEVPSDSLAVWVANEDSLQMDSTALEIVDSNVSMVETVAVNTSHETRPEEKESNQVMQTPVSPKDLFWWQQDDISRGTFALDNLNTGSLNEGRMRVRFHWKNALEDNLVKNGYIGIVLVDTVRQKYYSYPRRFLEGNEANRPEFIYDNGEQFSIRRFKIVNANVYAYSQPQQIVIFGYNQLGELLFRKRYNL